MNPLKFGLVTPFGDPRLAADLAYEAERAGWDGFFIGCEHHIVQHRVSRV